MKKYLLLLIFFFPFISFGAYDAPYGTGDRTADITVTTSFTGFTHNAGTCTSGYATCWVNGNTTTDQIYNPTSEAVSNKYIRFSFPENIIITEINWIQDGASSNGTFKVQGSTDGTSWTDIGSSFTLGDTNPDVVDLSSNTTIYSYYQIIGVSGTFNTGNYFREVEFSWIYTIPIPETEPVVFNSELGNLMGQGQLYVWFGVIPFFLLFLVFRRYIF